MCSEVMESRGMWVRVNIKIKILNKFNVMCVILL